MLKGNFSTTIGSINSGCLVGGGLKYHLKIGDSNPASIASLNKTLYMLDPWGATMADLVLPPPSQLLFQAIIF